MATISPSSSAFKHQLDLLSLYLVPSEPTHHVITEKQNSHTWIDLFIIRDKKSLISYSKTPSPFIAGHDLIELSIDCSKPHPFVKTFETRKLNDVDNSLLDNLLREFLPPPVISPPVSSCDINVNNTLKRTMEGLIRAYDLVAPLRKITISSKRKPWVTPQIRSLMHSRDLAYRRACQSTDAADFSQYRKLRSQVSNDLDTAKAVHISTKLSEASDPTAKWRTLRSLNISKASLPSPLDIFSANDLNQHYASVVNQASPLNRTTFNLICNSPVNISPLIPSFELLPVLSSDIEREIMRATSKSKGYDGVSIKMIRLALPALLGPLTAIVNESIASAIFPDEWKKTLIVPLAKSRKLSSPSDTRPIAQLSELSKVLERIVHRQLTGFLESNKLLSDRQAGFRKGHSTTTALACVTDDIRLAIDKRMITILILFDFSKAFDSIPHDILLAKLRALNFSNHSLNWFFSYLTGRIQAVVDAGGSLSEWLRSASGVPQGSVLGPLLFAVFINDLPAVLRFAKIMMFADDTQIYHHCFPSQIIEGLALINLDAQKIADWARDNGMKVNELKTKVMILGSELYISALNFANLPPIVINGVPVPFSNELKNLGLTLTPTLSFSSHVSGIVSRIHSSLYMLRHFNTSFTLTLRKELVVSLIFPLLDYACQVYDDLDNTRRIALQRAQNACVRFVFANIPFRSHVTPYRIKLGWLSAESRRSFATGCLAFSVLSRSCPEYLLSGFTTLANQEVRRSARNPTAVLLYPTPRTEALMNSFRIRAAKIVNRTGITEFSLEFSSEFRRLLRDILVADDKLAWHNRIVNEGIDPALRELQ